MPERGRFPNVSLLKTMGKVKLFLLCVRTGIAHSPCFMWHNIEYLFFNYNNNVGYRLHVLLYT